MRGGDADEPEGLAEGLRAGDPVAFEEVVRRYQHRVFAVALRMLNCPDEAEDAAQEVFLRVYRSAAQYRGDARLSTWLYAITSRLCLNRLAAADRRVARPGDEAIERTPGSDDPARDLEQREMRAALDKALAALPEERRILVVLRDLEGLSYEEIATVLELEPGTVRSRLHRARLELRDRLGHLLG